MGLIAAGIAYFIAFSRNTGDLIYAALSIDHQEAAWSRILLWGLPAAFVAAGLVGLERSGRFLLPKWLVWIGGFSYSLYLSHGLSINCIEKLGPRIGIHGVFAVSLLVPVFCVFNAWLVWTCIEKPLTVRAQRLVKTWAQSRIAQVAASKVRSS